MTDEEAGRIQLRGENFGLAGSNPASSTTGDVEQMTVGPIAERRANPDGMCGSG